MPMPVATRSRRHAVRPLVVYCSLSNTTMTSPVLCAKFFIVVMSHIALIPQRCPRSRCCRRRLHPRCHPPWLPPSCRTLPCGVCPRCSAVVFLHAVSPCAILCPPLSTTMSFPVLSVGTSLHVLNFPLPELELVLVPELVPELDSTTGLEPTPELAHKLHQTTKANRPSPIKLCLSTKPTDNEPHPLSPLLPKCLHPCSFLLPRDMSSAMRAALLPPLPYVVPPRMCGLLLLLGVQGRRTGGLARS